MKWPLLGQIGPCDGCHYRIQSFKDKWSKAHLAKTFTVTSVYNTAPYKITRTDNFTREDVEFQYGREKEAIKNSRRREGEQDFYLEYY